MKKLDRAYADNIFCIMYLPHRCLFHASLVGILVAVSVLAGCTLNPEYVTGKEAGTILKERTSLILLRDLQRYSDADSSSAARGQAEQGVIAMLLIAELSGLKPGASYKASEVHSCADLIYIVAQSNTAIAPFTCGLTPRRPFKTPRAWESDDEDSES